MRSWVWTLGTVGAAFTLWLMFRKAGDTPLQAGVRLAKTATSPAPVNELAGQLQEAWADHHTVA